MLCASHGLADPPPGADPVLHDWFDKQHSIKQVYCCNVSDGHILDDQDWHSTGTGYEIRVNGKWFPVPPDAMRDVITGGPNPTGHAVAWYAVLPWYNDGVLIYCFAPGFEG